MRIASTPTLVLACLLLAAIPWQGAAWGADEAPATVVVKRGPLGGALEVKGTVVPARYETVAAEPKGWRGKLEIVEAAAGGPVVKGEALVRFDDGEYGKAVRDRERKLEAARIDLDQRERGYALQRSGWSRGRSGWSRDLARAKRDKRHADEALERFVQVDRKLQEEEAEYAMEGRRISIQNQREELDQLEKMYKEDDLTEETEEIVLKRNRRNMERMLESFERYKKRWEYARTIDLPREHERLVEAAEQAATNLAWLEATVPQDLRKAELELEKAREDFEKAEADLAELRADEAVFALAAPIAGYAVRGHFDGSAWKNLGKDEAYEAGESVGVGQVVFTVVDESVLRVRTSVKEADLGDVQVGQPVSFKTALTGDDRLEGTVGAVARYGAGGTYDVVLRVTTKDERLRTGLAAEVEITRAAGKDTLSVPGKAVKLEKDGAWVWVVTGDGEPVRTKVELGRRAGGRVEIVSGVTAGQKLLAEPPAADGK